MEAWKTAVLVGSVAGAAAVLWPLGIWYEVRKCEKPKFVVVRPLGSKRSWLTGRAPAELRQYAPMLIAEVAVSGSMRECSSQGFRTIASFIFGNNTRADAQQRSGGGNSSSEAIAMTSPVRMEIEGSSSSSSSATIAMTSPVRMDMGGSESLADGARGDVKMSFVMPSKYDVHSLPRPNNPDVRIVQVPSHLAAALTFRGHIRGRQLVERKAQELRALLEAEGLRPVGSVKLYQYHPPFTFGWQRVNEVLFEVEEASSSKK